MTFDFNNYFNIFILAILGLVNLIALILVIKDKNKSWFNQERTPEALFFFWAICFGALGILAGMFLVRHKIRKWYFFFGVPLALIQNIIFLLAIFNVFAKL